MLGRSFYVRRITTALWTTAPNNPHPSRPTGPPSDGERKHSISQQLESSDWTHVVDEAIDLRHAIPRLVKTARVQVARFIADGYMPARVNGKFPDPQALSVTIAELTAQDRVHEAAMLARTRDEVRVSRTLAIYMSGCRPRAPIMTRADSRLASKMCVRRGQQIRLGALIVYDRDWSQAWHRAGHCLTEQSPPAPSA